MNAIPDIKYISSPDINNIVLTILYEIGEKLVAKR